MKAVEGESPSQWQLTTPGALKCVHACMSHAGRAELATSSVDWESPVVVHTTMELYNQVSPATNQSVCMSMHLHATLAPVQVVAQLHFHGPSMPEWRGKVSQRAYINQWSLYFSQFCRW